MTESVTDNPSEHVLSLEDAVHVDEACDRISELFDDIILIILSSLELKDSVKISILSKRWRHLWTYLIDLDFDPLNILKKPFYYSYLYIERRKYVNWVNHIVKNHKGPTIDKLKLHDCLNALHSRYIDTWVKFAISKRVKDLDLELERDRSSIDYSLGFNLLEEISTFDGGISSLTSLHLKSVGINGEALQFLMSRCQSLERLVVAYSKDLVRLKVVARKLKHLEIRLCYNLKELEIFDAANLVYFEYQNLHTSYKALHTDVSFRNVPLLVEAAFHGQCCFPPFPIFPQIACLSKHLSKLSLYLKGFTFRERISFPIIPCFSNVKHLSLMVDHDFNRRGYHFCRLLVTRFIMACPALQNLTFEIRWKCSWIPHEAVKLSSSYDDNLIMWPREDLKQERKCNYGINNAHSTLREVELDGFIGATFDVDVLLDIVDLAPALQTTKCRQSQFTDEEGLAAYRTRAYKLTGILPSSIKVIIIQGNR